MEKKGTSQILTTVLILVFIIIFMVFIKNDLIEKEFNLFQKTDEKKLTSNIILSSFNSTQILVKNENNFNLTYSQIQIGNSICILSGIITSKNYSLLDLTTCSLTLNTQINTVVLYTNFGLIEKVLTVFN